MSMKPPQRIYNLPRVTTDGRMTTLFLDCYNAFEEEKKGVVIWHSVKTPFVGTWEDKILFKIHKWTFHGADVVWGVVGTNECSLCVRLVGRSSSATVWGTPPSSSTTPPSPPSSTEYFFTSNWFLLFPLVMPWPVWGFQVTTTNMQQVGRRLYHSCIFCSNFVQSWDWMLCKMWQTSFISVCLLMLPWLNRWLIGLIRSPCVSCHPVN